MSMFRSLSRFVSTAFDTATNTLGTVEKGLDIANHYVAENHTKITRTTTTAAQLSLAAFHTDVAHQLAADSELAAQYAKVVAEW